MAVELVEKIEGIKQRYRHILSEDYYWHHYELKAMLREIVETFEIVEKVKQDKSP